MDWADPRLIGVGAVLLSAAVFFTCRRQQQSKPISYKSIQQPGKGSASKLLDEPDDGRPKVLFLVGSQTGTAEEYARRLSKDAARLGFRPRMVEMNDLDRDSLAKEPFVFIVVSTYGEGDPPDNAQEFHQWIMDESHAENALENVKYTVFSLGNKTYQHYQAMGRRLDQRFAQLGAQSVFERGEGDDDGALEDDFLAWQSRMWPAVCAQFGLTYSAESAGDAPVVEKRHRLVMHDSEHPAPPREPPKQPTGVPDAKTPFRARILATRELCTGGDRSTRHVEFDIAGSKISYTVGDHLGVYPENDPQAVEALARRLGAELDAPFSLRPLQPSGSSAHLKLPIPCTLREALTQYLDFNSPPRKAVLRVLAEYATDPQEKEALIRLSENTPEGRALYEQQIHGKDDQPYVTMLGVLQRFPSVRPDLGHFLELLPNLAVRYYSISSSGRACPGTVHITCVVTGVCTNYLRRLGVQGDLQTARVRLFVRQSTFRLPMSSETPIIMIGPGTGLAPFRGFIQERMVLQREGRKLGTALLFFGCRHPEQDFLYREELEAAVQAGVVTRLFTAFSRYQSQKVYVQHLLEQNADLIWSLLNEQHAHIYVCGDAKNMAKDVTATLTRIVSSHGCMDSEAASEWIASLGKAHRYHQDVW